MTVRPDARKPWLDRIMPSRPFAVLGLCYALGILFLALFRIAFLLMFRDQIADASVTDFAMSFMIGWRFDQIVVLWTILPLSLTVVWIGFQWRWARIITISYLTLIYSIITILLLADFRFFKYLHSHLNFQAVLYATEGGRTSWHLIVSEPMFAFNVVLWIVMTVAFPFVWTKLIRITQRIPERRNWISQIVWFVLFFALSALGIRGRTGLSPLGWGAAYFSDNHILNQSALNGLYTLGKAFTEEGRDPRVSYLQEPDRFSFVPFHQGLDSVRAMLGAPDDIWLEPHHSLLRTTKQPDSRFSFQPNIVLVLMESWSGRFTGSLGAPENLTPHFDSLAAHGILFTNFFASGVRTSYGLSAVICSFPALPGRSIMTRYNATHPFISLSELLHDRKYTNLFVYGGDLVFDNMKGLLTTKRYDRFYGDLELGHENIFAKWGIPDQIVFDKTIEIADTTPRPFQITVLSLTDHEPFDLPDSSVQRFFDDSESSRIRNAQVYADYALGSFMTAFSTKPLFDSTIFVFTSDHALWGYGRFHLDPTDFHIPLLIYSPSLLGDTGMVVTTIGGQVDILPTLMGLLGGDYTHASWGRNLLGDTPSDGGYAVTNHGLSIGLAQDSFLYAETLRRPPLLYTFADSGLVVHDSKNQFPYQFSAMQRRLRTFIQIADQLSTPTTDSFR